MSFMRRWLWATALILVLPAHAAELRLELLDGSTRVWSSDELLTHSAARTVRVSSDVAYQQDMSFTAVPLTDLLTGLEPEHFVQIKALDGFAVELPAALLSLPGSRAWLAIEDSRAPWPKLPNRQESAGPFYVVWTDVDSQRVSSEQWPYQVATIRLSATSETDAYSNLWPADDASADIKAGWEHFRLACLPCHRLNGDGSSSLGPDLNIPYNPTEYIAPEFLRRLIRDPQSVRRWPEARMRAVTTEMLGDAELEQVLAYLRHMSGRKTTSTVP